LTRILPKIDRRKPACFKAVDPFSQARIVDALGGYGEQRFDAEVRSLLLRVQRRGARGHGTGRWDDELLKACARYLSRALSERR
jgi:hypothetical protein